MIGRPIEIRSIGGMVYQGIVKSIKSGTDGELFRLGSAHDPAYERLVVVVDRATQIRQLASELDS